MLDGVEVGDARRVGAHRPRARSAAGADPDAVALCPVDEVRDHEEVAGEPHLRDDLQLKLGTVAHLVGDAVRVALVEPLLHLLAEPGVLGLPLRDGELRHVGADALVEDGLDLLRDVERVVAGLGQLAEEGAHLLGRLQVVAVAVELESLGLRLAGARGDTQQGVVGVRVVGVDVVQVVGGDQRQAQVFGQPQQVVPDPGLDVEPVVHQFDVEVALTEDVAELGGRGDRVVVLAEPQVRLHLAGRAARRRDEPLSVQVEKLPVGARLVEEALQRAAGAEPEQVVHALGVRRPHGHVGVGALRRDVVAGAVAELHALALAAPGARGEVGLEPDDRLNVEGLRRLVELVGAVQVAVIGDRQRRHTHPLSAREQVLDARGPVQHRELGVAVQVHERI